MKEVDCSRIVSIIYFFLLLSHLLKTEWKQ